MEDTAILAACLAMVISTSLIGALEIRHLRQRIKYLDERIKRLEALRPSTRVPPPVSGAKRSILQDTREHRAISLPRPRNAPDNTTQRLRIANPSLTIRS